MNIAKLTASITPNKARAIETVVTWAGPALFIPTLRFPLDKPEDRKELFVRDFSTYAVGSMIFLGTMGLTGLLLKKVSPAKITPQVKRLISFFAAFASYVLYCGIGAVKLSKNFTKNPRERALPVINFRNVERTQTKPTLNLKFKSGTLANTPHNKFNFASYAYLSQQIAGGTKTNINNASNGVFDAFQNKNRAQ